MSMELFIKRAARYLQYVIDPAVVTFDSGDARKTPLLLAVVICLLGLAALALIILIPIAYLTR